jgi:hypothetical protein
MNSSGPTGHPIDPADIELPPTQPIDITGWFSADE